MSTGGPRRGTGSAVRAGGGTRSRSLARLATVALLALSPCAPADSGGREAGQSAEGKAAAAEAGPGASSGAAGSSSAPRVATADDWPIFRGDPRCLGYRSRAPSDSPRLLWTWDSGSSFESTACIVGSRVYAATADGDLVALEIDPSGPKGKVLWKRSVDAGFQASPSWHEGKIFIGDDLGVFHVFDAESGKPRWEHDTEGAEIISSANFHGDLVLFGSYDARLYAFDSRSGRPVWQLETGGPVHCSPSLAGDFTFVAGCDAMLRVIDVRTGKEVWEKELDEYAAATPAARADDIYFGNFAAQVLAVGFRKKKVRWIWEPEKSFPFYASAASAPDALVVAGRDKAIHCLDPATGKERWSFPTRAGIDSSPVIAAERVICGSSDRTLYLLDLATGREVWKFAAEGGFRASPALGRGRLVIGDEHGLLYAFDVTGGAAARDEAEEETEEERAPSRG